MDERHRPLADLVRERLSMHKYLKINGWTGGAMTLPPVETARRQWRDAVTMQATLSGQGEAVADRVVVSMLNQMVHLARVASWWESQAEAAITETVDYASGNPAVASAPAQRVWDTYWSLHSLLKQMADPDPGELTDEEVQAVPGRMTDAEAEWRAAWDLWHTTQS
jgi:hypothetical protein